MAEGVFQNVKENSNSLWKYSANEKLNSLAKIIFVNICKENLDYENLPNSLRLRHGTTPAIQSGDEHSTLISFIILF